MFEQTKTLIVVYKDEMLLNEIRKLVETNDDTEDTIVGVKDGSVKIVSWDEKMWLSQKKNGTINNKVLFIGDIKDTDKLIPVLDVKFDKHGVKYGWAGNQAVLTCTPSRINEEEYQEFLEEIQSMDIPEFIKKANRVERKAEQDSEAAKDEAKTDVSNDASVKPGISSLFQAVSQIAKDGAEMIGDTIGTISNNTMKALSNDTAIRRRQLLFYGIITLYENDLQRFMDS